MILRGLLRVSTSTCHRSDPYSHGFGTCLSHLIDLVETNPHFYLRGCGYGGISPDQEGTIIGFELEPLRISPNHRGVASGRFI